MKKIVTITLIWIVTGCEMEYKRHDNDVEGYHWLGVTGNEEIRNDTIYTYGDKIGSDDFSFRIIKKVTDSTISYQYHDTETNGLTEYTATYIQKLMDDNPYLIVYHEASVSMYTRKRVCPINFKVIF